LIQHYVIKFVNDLRQVGGILREVRIPPPIKLTTTTIVEILLKVALNIIALSLSLSLSLSSSDTLKIEKSESQISYKSFNRSEQNSQNRLMSPMSEGGEP
jgi:hypothetical protein